jgi:hypothetical protein
MLGGGIKKKVRSDSTDRVLYGWIASKQSSDLIVRKKTVRPVSYVLFVGSHSPKQFSALQPPCGNETEHLIESQLGYKSIARADHVAATRPVGGISFLDFYFHRPSPEKTQPPA